MKRFVGLAISLAAMVAVAVVLSVGVVAGFPWPELIH